MRNPFKAKPFKAKNEAARLAPDVMNNTRLDALIQEMSKAISKRSDGYWQFNIDGRDLLVITDETHNRMRIMSPVANQADLMDEEFVRLLEANFGSALDAKYALRDGMLWSVFTHPLAELTDMQFFDCAAQVANLADNFGTSYASSNLTFGGG